MRLENRMRIHLVFSMAFALVTLAEGTDCRAQRTAQDSAAELIRQYTAGENKNALEEWGYRCPAADPYRDELFRRLLALSSSGAHESDLAGAWMQALSKCNDARITQWFHERAARTTDIYAALSLAIALAEARTEENLEALKQAAFRDDLPEEVREEMLSVAVDVGPMEQISWLLDGYRAGQSIPFGYLENRFHLGLERVGAADVERARRWVLDALESRPDVPLADEMVAMLLGDALSDPGGASWRTRLHAGLNRVAANPRASAAAREEAEGARAALMRVSR
jgi:hypothetical protein